MADQEAQLIRVSGREFEIVRDIELVLLELRAVAGLLQHRPAYTLVLRLASFVGIANPELVLVAEVVKDPARSEEVAHRAGHVGIDDSRRRRRENDGLKIVHVIVERGQEGGSLAMADRTGQRSFPILPLLGRLNPSKCVLGVEGRVAKQEVEGPMKLLRSCLGRDLQARAAGTGEQG